MIATLLLCFVPAPAPLPTLPTVPIQEAGDAEVDQKITEAGTDVAKLLELATSFSTAGKDDASKKVYKKIIELDPNHEAAHKALRHHNYNGKWFESYAELSKFRREETAKMKEQGLARYKDQWVPEADLPYLNMGWTKSEDGKWLNPVELARAKEEQEFKTKGHEFRADDSTWIAPEDKSKWAPDSWKCGDQWLNMEQANAYHSQPAQMWRIEGDHFTVLTTCDWEGGSWARKYADQLYPDLVRLFGLQPAQKPHFVVVNSLTQYNEAAGGQPPWLPESEGISSMYGAYFADAFFDVTATPPQYMGCGVSYWDRKDEKLRPWGPYWLRFAAAQSFCEAVDPSLLTISEAIASAASGGGGQGSFENFWKEKKIPRWMRYGAASYCDRYLKDPDLLAGGNPWALREFAFAEVKKAGGLRKIEDVFAFTIDPADPDAARIYHEAGLLVSFLLDGSESKKLKEKHDAFKAALRSGDKKELEKAVEGLQKELEKSEKEIKKFADL